MVSWKTKMKSLELGHLPVSSAAFSELLSGAWQFSALLPRPGSHAPPGIAGWPLRHAALSTATLRGKFCSITLGRSLPGYLALRCE